MPVMTDTVLVVIATYNERDNLPRLVEEVHKHLPQADILIIDDNSPDGTGQWAAERSRHDERLRVISRPGKLGLGSAIIAGLRYALEQHYTYAVNMDADWSHDPRHLPALLGGMDRYDVMIGSRYVAGGGVENWPRSRRWASRLVNGLARFLLRLPVHDCSGAYRCYRVSCLVGVPFARFLSRGYSFQEEMLYWCRLAGCRLGEAPILFRDRRCGQSKVNLREIVRSLAVLFWLGLRCLGGFDRAFKPICRTTPHLGRRSAAYPGPGAGK
ncbi:MAG: polyprenol monophosphomannose synthase [Gemmataceae bacterium]